MVLRSQLLKIIPDEGRVSSGDSILENHSKDLTYHQPHRPDVVVFVQTAQEVSDVLRFANEHSIPVTPFAIGTSLEGHVIPIRGGISLDLTLMNKVIEVRPNDLLVTVQPGVTRTQLNSFLRSHGLYFPLDPGADASLGGMAATNASGTTAVRYGVMRNQVLGLEVALVDGSIVHTGGMAFKSSSGYNLTGLFIGSEGTLGVITELTLRVHGIPEYTLAARATFTDVRAACNAAYTMISSGIQVGRVELVDEFTIAAVNRFKGTHYPEQPTLFLEFSGTRSAVDGDIAIAEDLCKDEGGTDFVFEKDAQDRNKLWEARHEAALAIAATAPGKKMKITDVCVPLSEMPGAIEHARETIHHYGIPAAILGHVGDGNYHVEFMVDPSHAKEMETADRLNQKIVEYALAHGGTCTGEHGVGIGKRQYMAREHEDTLPWMKAIKQTFDPKGILNPGKVIPD